MTASSLILASIVVQLCCLASAEFAATAASSNASVRITKNANGDWALTYTNPSLESNQWAGVGIGPNMLDQAVIVFYHFGANASVQSYVTKTNDVGVATGVTKQRGPPTFDDSLNVDVLSATLTGNAAEVQLVLPASKWERLASCTKINITPSSPLADNGAQLSMHPTTPQQFDYCPSA